MSTTRARQAVVQRRDWWVSAWVPMPVLAALLAIGVFYLASQIEEQVYVLSALLLLGAGVLGTGLGYWWCRRRFVDVTERYQALLTAREEEEDLWARMFDRLDEVDSGIEPKVRTALADLPPPVVDLDPVLSDVRKLGEQVSAIQTPEPEPVDLSSMEKALAELRAQIASLHVPERDDLNAADDLRKTLPDPDLAPVMNSLGDLSDGDAGLAPGNT